MCALCQVSIEDSSIFHVEFQSDRIAANLHMISFIYRGMGGGGGGVNHDHHLIVFSLKHRHVKHRHVSDLEIVVWFSGFLTGPMHIRHIFYIQRIYMFMCFFIQFIKNFITFHIELIQIQNYIK